MTELQRMTPPPRGEVREATPLARRLYVQTQRFIGAIVTRDALSDLQQDEYTHFEFSYLFEELNDAITHNTLEPPIDTDSPLAGIVSDFSVYYKNAVEHKLHPNPIAIQASIDALYAVVDHGSHQVTTNSSERLENPDQGRSRNEAGFSQKFKLFFRNKLSSTTR